MLRTKGTFIFIFIISFHYSNTIGQTRQKFGDLSFEGVEFNGRIGRNNPEAADIYWPGSSVKIRFKGTEMKAVLKDQRGHNYFNVIIDDDSVYRIRLDTLQKEYTLASGLPDGIHTVELFRRTDWNDGVTRFYGFSYSKAVKILDLPRKKRMIEFYGNSITVGSGNEDYPGSETSTNNYMSYGAIAARHYNATFSCIARSGIGLTVSWFSMIMPEMYDRLNPYDSLSKWDFSRATPGMVVINLLQNDCALAGMPDYDQFKHRFGTKAPTEAFIVAAYSKFVKQIRNRYPNAHIVCVLGSMDAVKPGSPWPGYISKAVSTLGDQKTYTYFFPYNGTGEHPKVEEHKQMAEGLIRFIDENIKW